MAPEERMKTEASHKAIAAGGGKMTVLHSPVGVRSIVTSLVAFFILASSIVFLLDRGQEEQVQVAVEHGRQEVQVKLESGLQEPAIRGTTEEGAPATRSATHRGEGGCTTTCPAHCTAGSSAPSSSLRWPVTSMAGRMPCTSTGDGSLMVMDATSQGMMITTDFPSIYFQPKPKNSSISEGVALE